MDKFSIPMTSEQESDIIDSQLYGSPWGFTIGEHDYLNKQLSERGLKWKDYTHYFDTRNYVHVFTLKEERVI